VSKGEFSIRYAEYSVTGHRPEMEDSFIADLTFGKKFSKTAKLKSIPTTDEETGSIFGVFDGHTGAVCSTFVSRNLPRILFENDNFPNNPEKALIESFPATDEEFLKTAKSKKLEDGSTGIVALLIKDTIYVANAGDSRGVICEGESAVAMSQDHKPENEGEKARIEKYGGQVKKGRINGKLAVSRGFGDLPYKNSETLKEKFVTVEPDIKTFKITKETKFFLLACDGLWDTLSNDDAIQFVRGKLAGKEKEEKTEENRDLYNICIELTRLAYDKGSTDNISCILVTLEHTS